MNNDTISVAFEDGYEYESLALFSRRSGKKLLEAAIKFAKLEESKNVSSSEAILDFWSYLHTYDSGVDISESAVSEGFYLGLDGQDGDNKMNGHYVVSLITGQVLRHTDVY